MIYVLYRLNWIEGIGYPVDEQFAELQNPISASQFAEAGAGAQILGYCTTEAMPTEADCEIVTKDQALAFAASLDESARVLSNGKIISTKNLKPSDLQEFDFAETDE